MNEASASSRENDQRLGMGGKMWRVAIRSSGPGWVSNYRRTWRDVPSHDATGTDYGIRAYGHSGEEYRACPDPYICSYCDRPSTFQTLPTQLCFARVVCCQHLDVGPNLAAVSHLNPHDIQEHTAKIKKYFVAHIGVVPVIAVKRATDHHFFANRTQQLTKEH